MKKPKVLRPKQMQALKLLARGETKKYVAERLEVATMTVYRWQRDPTFQTQLESLLASGLEATAKKIHIAGITAAETAQEFLCDMSQPAEVRAKMAVALLRVYPALQTALAKSVRQRVADFELDERWTLPTNTFDQWGEPTAASWANREPVVVNADGSIGV